jgi:hypothetical protein
MRMKAEKEVGKSFWTQKPQAIPTTPNAKLLRMIRKLHEGIRDGRMSEVEAEQTLSKNNRKGD